MIVMARQKSQVSDWGRLLTQLPHGKSVTKIEKRRHVFRQGDPADAVFYLQRGKVKVAVTSKQEKEAIVAVLDAGDFFGEGRKVQIFDPLEKATHKHKCLNEELRCIGFPHRGSLSQCARLLIPFVCCWFPWQVG